MLEALIPFVEYPLKLPLALFIKFSEVKLIINAFRSLETLNRFGLNAASGNPTDILCALTGIPPDTLKMLMSLSETMNGSSFSPEMLSGLSGQSGMDFSNIAAVLGQLNAQSANQTTSHSYDEAAKSITHSPDETRQNMSHSFDEAIQKILSDYDMSQAESYLSESEPDQS